MLLPVAFLAGVLVTLLAVVVYSGVGRSQAVELIMIALRGAAAPETICLKTAAATAATRKGTRHGCEPANLGLLKR